MQDPVEPGAHQKHDVSVLQGQGARCRDRQRASGCSSGITPLPIGECRKGICVRSTTACTSSLARDLATPLPR
jgi:hypothetical protein